MKQFLMDSLRSFARDRMAHRALRSSWRAAAMAACFTPIALSSAQAVQHRNRMPIPAAAPVVQVAQFSAFGFDNPAAIQALAKKLQTMPKSDEDEEPYYSGPDYSGKNQSPAVQQAILKVFHNLIEKKTGDNANAVTWQSIHKYLVSEGYQLPTPEKMTRDVYDAVMRDWLTGSGLKPVPDVSNKTDHKDIFIPMDKDGLALMGLPLDNFTITDTFRWRNKHPSTGERHVHHDGTDFAAPYGSSIKSAAAGTISFNGWVDGYGNLACIAHPFSDRNGKSFLYESCYGHMIRLSPYQVGMPISKHAEVGLVGHSGRTAGATGDHVHWEIKYAGNGTTLLNSDLFRAAAQKSEQRKQALAFNKKLDPIISEQRLFAQRKIVEKNYAKLRGHLIQTAQLVAEKLSPIQKMASHGFREVKFALSLYRATPIAQSPISDSLAIEVFKVVSKSPEFHKIASSGSAVVAAIDAKIYYPYGRSHEAYNDNSLTDLLLDNEKYAALNGEAKEFKRIFSLMNKCGLPFQLLQEASSLTDVKARLAAYCDSLPAKIVAKRNQIAEFGESETLNDDICYLQKQVDTIRTVISEQCLAEWRMADKQVTRADNMVARAKMPTREQLATPIVGFDEPAPRLAA